MSNDSDGDPAVSPGPDDIDDLPTVSCERCGRKWDLAYELEEVAVGNQAFEQFALDHQRHTGHFPDGISTWGADCRQCPEAIQRLDERAARRWAETHARHTGHAVEVDHAEKELTVIERPE